MIVLILSIGGQLMFLEDFGKLLMGFTKFDFPVCYIT